MTSRRIGAASCCAALALGLALSAQQPAPYEANTESKAQSTGATHSNELSAKVATAPSSASAFELSAPVNEEQLKHLLSGKPLFLRSGYLDNSLNFSEHGQLINHSERGSYTLSAIQIDKVKLTKHKVELQGTRYGLHFVGQLASEDSSKAFDRVRITPRKKVVKITIDREMVVAPKKMKKEKNKPTPPQAGTAADPVTAPLSTAERPKPNESASNETELSEADQLKAAIAAAPEAERPADPKSVTTTISPAHAAQVLKQALDSIFASELDERMLAALPDFWKLYYRAAAAHTDYRPQDPAVLRQNTVDRKAKLLTTFEPASNEYAQANAVAGMALYHAVVGTDGKPAEIAVGRPIGFGLDENAVAAIRNARFEPALKDGKPVSVWLDLVVQFRIYSNRTAVSGQPNATDKPAAPVLPGPFSVQHP